MHADTYYVCCLGRCTRVVQMYPEFDTLADQSPAGRAHACERWGCDSRPVWHQFGRRRVGTECTSASLAMLGNWLLMLSTLLRQRHTSRWQSHWGTPVYPKHWFVTRHQLRGLSVLPHQQNSPRAGSSGNLAKCRFVDCMSSGTTVFVHVVSGVSSVS